jgi:dihydrofolate reductase
MHVELLLFVLSSFLVQPVAMFSLLSNKGWIKFAKPPELTICGSTNVALSVDGFIATKDGSVDFLSEFPTDSEDDDFGFANYIASVDVIVMGRKSFEKVLSFGKEQWAYGDTRMVVWTRHPDRLEIPEHLEDTVSASSKAPFDLFYQLQKEGHKHVYVDGGVTIQEFLAAGCVQQMTLSRVPILLGKGIPLFSAKVGRKKLRHLDTKTWSSGLVTSIYEVLSNDEDSSKDSETKQTEEERE